jgi:hypothetical protein
VITYEDMRSVLTDEEWTALHKASSRTYLRNFTAKSYKQWLYKFHNWASTPQGYDYRSSVYSRFAVL